MKLFCLTSMDFVFNGEFYQQVERAAMSFPNTPIVENLFLTQSSNVFNVNLTDNVVTGGPSRPKYKLSGTVNRLLTDLPRKRKNSPVSLVCDSPDLKRKSNPVAGRRRIKSEMNSNTNPNLITNHFQFSSSARHTGRDGQAELGAAGVLAGRDDEGRGEVHDARAKRVSGLAVGGLGGKPELSVSADNIGPDRSAVDVLTNPGSDNIQLTLYTLQRGNSKENSSKSRQ